MHACWEKWCFHFWIFLNIMLYPCFLMLIVKRLYIFLEVNCHKTIARRLVMEYNTRRIYMDWAIWLISLPYYVPNVPTILGLFTCLNTFPFSKVSLKMNLMLECDDWRQWESIILYIWNQINHRRIRTVFISIRSKKGMHGYINCNHL